MDLTTSHIPSHYVFPVLRHSDILQCMSELGVELTKAELVEPIRHRDRLKKVFVALLEICCGVSEEELERVSPLMQDTLKSISKYPQTHEDFSDLRFFLELRRFMEDCGYHDLGWKDLHSPTAKRFRCQISAAINMAKFREDQLKLYAELNEPRVELLCALEEANEENSHLVEQLTVAQTDSDNKSKEIEQVGKECKELEVEITRYNNEQKARREEAAELKMKHNDLKDELATAKLALEETQVDWKSLRTKIVSSPERKKKKMMLLRETMKTEREETSSLEENWQKTKTIQVHISQAIKDISETTKSVNEVLEERQKISETQNETQDIKTKKDTISKQCIEASDELLSLEATLNRSEEKFSHLRKQHRLKMDAALESFEYSKLELLKVEKEHLEGMSRVEAGENEVKSMENLISNARRKAESEIAIMIQNFKKTESNILEQNVQLLGLIQKFDQTHLPR
mmetsp:Transcript_42424/g.48191  ORF Transcript_42424/g.48191 Transcript_42424/m.48191 type:complete len:459 (-) Transcript_42424:249-1625(-)